MLSRIAESLFWIGRYVERADGTARIVDVLRLQQIEDGGASTEESARHVLSAVMGLPTPQDRPVTFEDVGQQLVFDTSRASTISGTWWTARENARRARETLSTELWECINTSWHRWRDLGQERVTADHLAWVRERAALVAGIADATMSHDEALDFLILGRMLERADMTARLVATAAIPGGESAWLSVLQSCGASQAYLRTNRGVVTEERAAAFLVLDRLFPRSIVYALTEAERRLNALDPGVDRIGFSDEASRMLGRIRTSLEYRSFPDVLPELAHQMGRVQRTVMNSSDAITRRYFQVQAVQWTEELV